MDINTIHKTLVANPRSFQFSKHLDAEQLDEVAWDKAKEIISQGEKHKYWKVVEFMSKYLLTSIF